MDTHNPRTLTAVHQSFWKLLYITAFLWVLAVVDIDASSHPEGGDGSGLSIKLEVPWNTFKIGEKFVFRYTLNNASDKPVPIAIPVAKIGLGSLTGGQPFLEAFRTGGRKAENPDYDIHKAVWPPRTNVDEEPQTWTWLQPGQKLTWNQNQIWPGYYGVGCYQSFEGFQAHWLVGPNRWISSEPVPIKIVSVPMTEWTEAFKVNWSSYGYGKDSHAATVYRIPIEGKMYLFFDGPFRVTEVGPDDQFEHQIDKDGTNLEITIKNAKGSRRVYFHLRQGLTRDTPWPIGPVELFDPKPEPIPPAELEALRKVAFPSLTTADKRPDKKSGLEMTPTNGNLRVTGNAKRNWLWLVVGFAVIGGALIIVILRKFRQRACSNRDGNG